MWIDDGTYVRRVRESDSSVRGIEGRDSSVRGNESIVGDPYDERGDRGDLGNEVSATKL